MTTWICKRGPILVAVAALVLAPCFFTAAADQPEPPVRLKKKASPRAAEPAPEPKPEPKRDEPKEKPADREKKPEQPRPPAGDDEPDPAEPEVDSREVLNRVSKNMRNVEDLLAKRDAGSRTRETQRDIVNDLDKLINQQQRQQQQQQQQAGGGGSSQQQMMRRQQQNQRTAQQRRQQQLQRQQQERDQMAQANGKQAGAGGRSQGPASKIADLYKDIWGHLPETMRQEMDAYSREQFMAKYNDLLKQYYSTLAEKGRRQGD
jgi:hypothetical protein